MGLGSLSGGTKWDKFPGSIENALAKSPLPIPKRASILLSQLSQVPGLSQFSGVPSSPIAETEIKATSSRSKGDRDTKTKINLPTSSTSTSLLDEDVPPISSSTGLQPSLIPSRSTTPSGAGSKKATMDDGDDEWNWSSPSPKVMTPDDKWGRATRFAPKIFGIFMQFSYFHPPHL
ncbi:hypothetical protein PQX77_005756 [Marasmius sp. AFHP31]|nr:hypothetical protein PQX77_005756 [Marasmius sp. AFHP31]